MIELRGVNFRYPEGKVIFSDFSFTLNRGDRIGLIGNNGSGKTTLLRLIMGLLKPDGGDIEILGSPRKADADFLEVRRRIGLLFQDADDQLFCPSVEEDIAFGPLNLGKTNAEAREMVKHACQVLGINGLEKKITYRLSGGEKRLVALATLVAMNPECYLLDEPTAGLDEATSGRFLGYLRESVETCLIISHDQNFLTRAVDRVYAVRDGSLLPLERGRPGRK
ncbi:MAG: ABC transporter ATP-binding protein [Smithellaceae bacterium]|nr:ABC transporter ATP-binding protein [Smithellaceae bacterium]